MNKNKKCKANLKTGKRCQYPAKIGLNGFCGIHKNLTANNSDDEKNLRLVALLTAGDILVRLTGEAVKYLPELIEVMHKASELMYCKENAEDFKNMPEYVEMIMTANEISHEINSSIIEQNWNRLYINLFYELDLILNSGNVPKNLLSKIYEARDSLSRELDSIGYSPSKDVLSLRWNKHAFFNKVLKW